MRGLQDIKRMLEVVISVFVAVNAAQMMDESGYLFLKRRGEHG